MSLLDRIKSFSDVDRSAITPFFIDGVAYGLVGRAALRSLQKLGGAFTTGRSAISLTTDPRLSPEHRVRDRSAALDRAVDQMIDDGVIRRRRNELYDVVNRWGEAPAALVDRGAMTAFGFLAFGVHVNGYTGGVTGRRSDRRLWVGRRSADRAIAPGKLDCIVAGGIGDGHSITGTLIKEAYEEAGLSAEIALMARPAGTVSYIRQENADTGGGRGGEGVRRDVLFIFDLAVPDTVIPRNTDGEVAAFTLMPLDDVEAMLERSDDFKFNVGPVIIDFLIRTGWIAADHPDYQQMIERLHGKVSLDGFQ